ncbi:MAG: AmmeMemoRadiSam system protein B [Thermodesulfobacteriota bacterium]
MQYKQIPNRNQFLNSDVRDSFLSGLSYPKDKNDLEKLINGFYKKAVDSDNKVNGKLKGIISPHIDFNRGGISYAIAYRELIEQTDADTFLIFGTTHYARNSNPFILTKKSFSTPLGTVETDREFIEKLETKCSWDLFEGEIYHRNEHSIEFQVVFLKHILGNRKNFKIIPILCNSFHEFVKQEVSPKSDHKIKSFFDVLKETISEHSGSLLIIAGVDMAHVGPKFGDPDPVDNNTISWIEQRDNLTLSFAEKIDAEGFYKSVEEEKDKRKICGLSSIYSLLNVIDADRGKVLNYDKALEPDTGSIVTFASAAFYK